MNDIELWQGDCLELMENLKSGSIDAIITDLPYGTTACKWDTVIEFAPMWKEVKRVLKPNGAFITTASQPFTSALIMSNPKAFRYEIIWDKVKPSSGLHAKIQPLRQHENIIVFGGNRYFPIMEKAKNRIDKPRLANNGEAFGGKSVLRQHQNNGLSYPRSILSISNADQTSRIHPTQKPVALYEYLIKTYTNEGDTVLDMCMGSGTTGVACINTNRKFIGIEKDEKYFNIAKERIDKSKIL